MLYALQDPALAHDEEKCNALMIRYNDLRGIQSIMAKRFGRQSRIAINYFRRHMCGSLRQEASPLSKYCCPLKLFEPKN